MFKRSRYRRRLVVAAVALAAFATPVSSFAEDEPDPKTKELLRDPTEAFLIRLQRHLLTLGKPVPDPPPMVHECQLALPGLREIVRKSSDNDKKAVAIGGLVWMYPVSEFEAPVLLDALKDREPSVRATAALAISRFLPDADDTSPALAKALNDKDGAVRGAAAQSLGELGPMSAFSADALAKMADSDELDTARGAALEALSYLAPQKAAPRMLGALKSNDVPVKWAACMALRRIPAPANDRAATLAALRELVMDDHAEPAIRASAFTALWAQAPEGADASAALEAAVTLPPGENRTAMNGDRRFLFNFAARMKATPGPEPTIILKALREWPLKDEEITSIIARRFAGDTLPAELQTGLLEILSHRGKGDAGLAEKITEIVSITRSQGDFIAGMRYLRRAGVSGDDRAAMILARTREARSEVGQIALTMVEELGDDAKKHTDLLTEAFDSMPTRAVAGEVMLKLKICPPEVAERLVEILNEAPDSAEKAKEGREAAARLLVLTGKDGVTTLRETANDKEKTRFVRAAAIRGLGDAGEAAAQDVPMMIDALMGDDSYTRLAARDALAALGDIGADALLTELKSETPKRAHRAFTVFYRMGPAAKKWTAALVDAHASGRMRGGGNEKMDSLFDTLSDTSLPLLIGVMEKGEPWERRAAAAVVEPMAMETLAANADRLTQLTTKFIDLVPLRTRLASDVLPTLPDGRARLEAILGDRTRATREAASIAMVDHGWVDDRVIDTLAEVADVQSIRALGALQRLGPRAKRVMPRLLGIARDPKKFSRENYYAMAMAVVVSIDRGPDRLTLLHEFLGSPRWFDPGAAAAMIYCLPRDQAVLFVPEMRSALERQLKTDNPEKAVVQMLARSLRIVDPETEFLETLIKVLEKSESEDRRFLGEIVRSELDSRTNPGIAALTERLLDTTLRGTTLMDRGLLMREIVYRADKRGLPVLRVVAARTTDDEVREMALLSIADLEAIISARKPATKPASP